MIKRLIKSKRDGAIFLSPLVRYVKGGVIVPAQAQFPLTVAAGAAGNPTQAIPVTIQGSEDAVTEIFSLMGAQDAGTLADVTNRFTVQITDTAWTGRRYMNRPILANHVFGSRLQPFFLMESIVLEQQQAMQFQFFNASVAGAANWRMALEMRKFQRTALEFQEVQKWAGEQRIRKAFLYPFWQTTDAAVTIPAGGTSEAFMSNTSDLWLYLFVAMAQGISTGVAGDLQEMFTVEVFDAKTKRPLQNSPISLNNFGGSSNFPYPLPTPIMVEPTTQIQLRLRNLITDQPTEAFITFAGIAHYTGAGLWNQKAVAFEDQGPLMELVGERK